MKKTLSCENKRNQPFFSGSVLGYEYTPREVPFSLFTAELVMICCNLFVG